VLRRARDDDANNAKTLFSSTLQNVVLPSKLKQTAILIKGKELTQQSFTNINMIPNLSRPALVHIINWTNKSL
jgi:hypothetical protein